MSSFLVVNCLLIFVFEVLFGFATNQRVIVSRRYRRFPQMLVVFGSLLEANILCVFA
jgi:hypothetical protein